MPTSKSSLINFSTVTKNKIESLFQKSLSLKANFLDSNSEINQSFKKTAALLFFEPSTRTRFSFESACVRAGYHPLILDGAGGTSLEKGETILDTVLNIQAMRPAFFVIRCNNDFDLQSLTNTLSVPVINAGWGIQGHPTQALLDMLSLYEKWTTVENKKILFVGDVKHSRVVASHFELAKILNYQIAVCSPQQFLPSNDSKADYTYFDKLSEGLSWADVVIALRVQKERHDGSHFDVNQYRNQFGLNATVLKNLNANAFIMHPGPINYGIEMQHEVLSDSRSLILQQVENGVFLREALILDLFKTN